MMFALNIAQLRSKHQHAPRTTIQSRAQLACTSRSSRMRRQ